MTVSKWVRSPAAWLTAMAAVAGICPGTGHAGGPPPGSEVVASSVRGAVFAQWQTPAGEQRVAVSLDDGATWSRPRPAGQPIALRAGILNPPHDIALPPQGLTAKSGSRLFIVQFATQSLAAWRARLGELGAEVLTFLPYCSHVVRMDAAVAELVRQESFVRWVGPYQPGHRLAGSLLAELGEGGVTPRRYVLQTFIAGTAEKSRLAAEVGALGGAVVAATPNGYLLEAELNSAQALALLHSDYLQWLELWTPPEDDMDIVRSISGANHVESVAGYDGSGLRAEVMDSGIMLDHQDFDGIIVHGGAPDVQAHGTATYGIVFGNGDRDGDGDAQGTGMLPAAQGYFADYGELDDRYAHTAELVSSPIEAVFQTNSWGGGRTLHYTAVSAEMDDIIWTYDIPIFQSQSNAGDQYSRPQAWAKNIISVGGVYHYDDPDPANHCWCDGASIGPAADGRIKPDLTFFYDETWTTDMEPGGYLNGSLYANFGGTSGATPMTAGTGGLILLMWADDLWGATAPGATVFERRPHAATLKALMVNTSSQYEFSGLDHDHARVRQGWGLPDAGAAYDRAALTRVIDESSVLGELQFDAYSAVVAAGQPELKVTLVYSDRAASPAAAIHRVNDVSLRVIDPSGTEYWGNAGLDLGPWSAAGGSADTLNTVENVFIANPAAGTWRVEVHADEVNMDVHVETPEDDQDYALVVYGVSSLDECRSPIPAPTGVSATPTSDNQVTVSWSGSAPEYEVWRAEGGCSFPRQLVATVSATSWVDGAVPGGVVHGFLVRAVDGCPSPDSECVEATTSGPCPLPPRFDGLGSAWGINNSFCDVTLAWSGGQARCGGPLVYNVYRSVDTGFEPGPDSLVGRCIDRLSWLDTSLPNGDQSLTWVVRAEDLAGQGSGPCGGLEDDNLVRRTLTPTTLLATDFESGLEGWTPLIPESSVTGDWVADDPRGTSSGASPAQPEDAAQGLRCLYTARNPNSDVGRSDVDYGEVAALSPLFDASPFASVELSLWRWYFIRDLGMDPNDFFAIDASSDGGSSWVNLETQGNSATGLNAWNQVVFHLEDHLPLTASMMVRVRASDGQGHNNILEAAIDDVVVRGLDGCVSEPLFADDFETGNTSQWSAVVP